MKFFKRCVYAVLLMGIVFAALYFIPVRSNVDMSLPCVIWEMDDRTTGETEGIVIKGRYYDYLIKDDRFKGSIRISEVNDYEEEVVMKLRVSNRHGMQSASVHYYSSIYHRRVILGSLYMQGKFDNMLIFLNGSGTNVLLNDKIVSAPATTIEEAVAIAEAMNFA